MYCALDNSIWDNECQKNARCVHKKKAEMARKLQPHCIKGVVKNLKNVDNYKPPMPLNIQ